MKCPHGIYLEDEGAFCVDCAPAEELRAKLREVMDVLDDTTKLMEHHLRLADRFDKGMEKLNQKLTAGRHTVHHTPTRRGRGRR